MFFCCLSFLRRLCCSITVSANLLLCSQQIRVIITKPVEGFATWTWTYVILENLSKRRMPLFFLGERSHIFCSYCCWEHSVTGVHITVGLPLWETARANTCWCREPEASSESKHRLPSLNQYQPPHPCPPLPPPELPFIHILNMPLSNSASTIIYKSTFCWFSCPSELLRRGASCIYILMVFKVQMCKTSWLIYKD